MRYTDLGDGVRDELEPRVAARVHGNALRALIHVPAVCGAVLVVEDLERLGGRDQRGGCASGVIGVDNWEVDDSDVWRGHDEMVGVVDLACCGVGAKDISRITALFESQYA
tara:strand:+ start:4278 stop:4610 length:333 start_codon:yes stop_codon:yes gene_type:complete